jgi:membrane-associated protease RseP (regulator of RpoE activity)
VTDTTVRPPEPPAPTPPGAPEGEIVGGGWRLGLLMAGIVALGVFAGTGWLVIVGALVVMIFLHELGHFLAAKWAGMKVTEFFIFFGPKIWSFKRGETEYGIKLIPLGAYVRIIGMSNVDPEVAPEDEPRTYRQQSFPKRMVVITAGSMMHFAQAFVLLAVMFSVLGVPGESQLAERLGGPKLDEQDWFVGNVVEGSAAQEAGLRQGDDIRSIDGQAVSTFEDVGPLVAPNPGERLELLVDRDGELVELTATIGRAEGDADRGFLGIGPDFPELPAVTVNPIRGVLEAGELTISTMGQTVTSLGSFFTGGVDDFAADVADGGTKPVAPTAGSSDGGARVADEGDANRLISIYGVARIGAGASEEGIVDVLLLLAMVNISIGVLNLIPLLPLDGGHAAIAIYERIRSRGGRRHMADVSRLLPLTYAVVVFMLLLGVSSIYLDIVDPVGVG